MGPCLNFSQDTISPDLWTLSDDYFGPGIGVGIILAIFMLIAVPWNSFLIGIIIKKCLFKEPAILLLLNLAITDLLISLFFLPFNIIPALTGEYIFGNSDYTRCQVCQTGIVFSILLAVSIHNVALLSLDRFLYIKMPLKYKKIVTKN